MPPLPSTVLYYCTVQYSFFPAARRLPQTTASPPIYISIVNGSRDGTIMTARPSVGQRLPPKSLSANLLQRTSSPSSPSKRSNDSPADVPFDGPDVALQRYGGAPRNGGSRLKLETSRDSQEAVCGSETAKAPAEAPHIWRPPRGRPQLHFDVPSVSNPGPRAAQEGTAAEVAINPMPLPVRPGKHLRPSLSRPRREPGNLQKKDARPKPYILEVPAAAARYSPGGMLRSAPRLYVLY